MPIYEYKCGCGHVTEDMRKLSEREDPGPPCEDCGGLDTERLVSATKRQTFRLGNQNRRGARENNLKEI